MHRISDFRMSGISTRNFKMFRQLCGDSTLKNVVIVTNMWGEVSKEIGIAREIELAKNDKFFKPVLEKGAQMLRHANDEESVRNILRTIINNQPLSLQIQREMVDQQKDISQTAAGAELNRELLIQREKHEGEMKQLREEMKGNVLCKIENHVFNVPFYGKRPSNPKTKKPDRRSKRPQNSFNKKSTRSRRTHRSCYLNILRRRQRWKTGCKNSLKPIVQRQKNAERHLSRRQVSYRNPWKLLLRTENDWRERSEPSIDPVVLVSFSSVVNHVTLPSCNGTKTIQLIVVHHCLRQWPGIRFCSRRRTR